MSMMDSLRKGLDRARDGAAGLAERARIRMEITALERRRREYLESIGARVYERWRAGEEFPGVEDRLGAVRALDDGMRQKRAELRSLGPESGSPGGRRGAQG